MTWQQELTAVVERLEDEPLMRATRRVSPRGVPHLIVQGKARAVSVCWTGHAWRTLSPCFGAGLGQHNREWEQADLEDMVAYLRNEVGRRPEAEAPDVWITRMGERVRVCEMGDGHLVNTIHFLQRRATRSLAALTALYVTGPLPRGDMAQELFDQEFNAILEATWDDRVPPIFWFMLQEAEKRGISVALPTDREDLMQRLRLELTMMGR